jgi:predicted SprT family Zn-dependent metalloprotease
MRNDAPCQRPPRSAPRWSLRCVAELHPLVLPAQRGQVPQHGPGIPRMTPTDRTTLARIPALLRDWGHRWGLADLGRSVQVEWGRRFRRSLGRVHLDRRVVRLAEELALAPPELLREVLCHEIAHLAARDLHGRHCRPHGPEWAALVRAAGFAPRRRIPWSPPSSPSQPKRAGARARGYIHRCPVCHLRWTAGRPVRQWRCPACVAAGLSGQLEITPPPALQRP